MKIDDISGNGLPCGITICSPTLYYVKYVEIKNRAKLKIALFFN